MEEFKIKIDNNPDTVQHGVDVLNKEMYEQIINIICEARQEFYTLTRRPEIPQETDDTPRLEVVELGNDLYVEQKYKLLIKLVEGEPYCFGTYDENAGGLQPLTEKDKIHCETLKIRYNKI